MNDHVADGHLEDVIRHDPAEDGQSQQADAATSVMDFPAEITITDPDVIAVVSNPVRLTVLEELYDCQRPRTATQLAGMAGVSPSSMSYHLRLLGKTGLIRRATGSLTKREAPWEASAKSFSFAVSEHRDPTVRMRLMDGILRTLRMRINALMEASADVPIEQRRERYPFTPLSIGNLILDHDELLQVQQEIWAVWERYEKLSAGRRPEDHDYSVAYSWSCLPSNIADKPRA